MQSELFQRTRIITLRGVPLFKGFKQVEFREQSADVVTDHGKRIDFQQLKSFFQNFCLFDLVKGIPQGISKRLINKENARRFNLFRDFHEQGNRCCWNAGFFDHTLDQSNGLIADRSDWSQQDRIDLVIPNLFQNLRSCVFQ